MRAIILFTICTAGLLFTSCENKERLEEIKATLKNERPSHNSNKETVSFSSPELNLPEVKQEEVDYSGMSEGMSDYSESEYDDSYEDSDYDSDYDYDSEYKD